MTEGGNAFTSNTQANIFLQFEVHFTCADKNYNYLFPDLIRLAT